jgi:hypothetical protein
MVGLTFEEGEGEMNGSDGVDRERPNSYHNETK